MTTFRRVNSCGERDRNSSSVSRMEMVVLQLFSRSLMGSMFFFPFFEFRSGSF